MSRSVEAIFRFFRAENWTHITGRGDLAYTQLDRDTCDFEYLIGSEVVISTPGDERRSGLFMVRNVERSLHMPPWRRGETIGLLVERIRGHQEAG